MRSSESGDGLKDYTGRRETDDTDVSPSSIRKRPQEALERCHSDPVAKRPQEALTRCRSNLVAGDSFTHHDEGIRRAGSTSSIQSHRLAVNQSPGSLRDGANSLLTQFAPPTVGSGAHMTAAVVLLQSIKSGRPACFAEVVLQGSQPLTGPLLVQSAGECSHNASRGGNPCCSQQMGPDRLPSACDDPHQNLASTGDGPRRMWSAQESYVARSRPAEAPLGPDGYPNPTGPPLQRCRSGYGMHGSAAPSEAATTGATRDGLHFPPYGGGMVVQPRVPAYAGMIGEESNRTSMHVPSLGRRIFPYHDSGGVGVGWGGGGALQLAVSGGEGRVMDGSGSNSNSSKMADQSASMRMRDLGSQAALAAPTDARAAPTDASVDVDPFHQDWAYW